MPFLLVLVFAAVFYIIGAVLTLLSTALGALLSPLIFLALRWSFARR